MDCFALWARNDELQTVIARNPKGDVAINSHGLLRYARNDIKNTRGSGCSMICTANEQSEFVGTKLV